MSAHDLAQFLPHHDSIYAPAGAMEPKAVVGILPGATPHQLIAVAQARLNRQVSMLAELSCPPTDTEVCLVPVVDLVTAALQEVENLLEAARERMPKEGGSGS